MQSDCKREHRGQRMFGWVLRKLNFSLYDKWSHYSLFKEREGYYPQTWETSCFHWQERRCDSGTQFLSFIWVQSVVLIPNFRVPLLPNEYLNFLIDALEKAVVSINIVILQCTQFNVGPTFPDRSVKLLLKKERGRFAIKQNF